MRPIPDERCRVTMHSSCYSSQGYNINGALDRMKPLIFEGFLLDKGFHRTLIIFNIVIVNTFLAKVTRKLACNRQQLDKYSYISSIARIISLAIANMKKRYLKHTLIYIQNKNTT